MKIFVPPGKESEFISFSFPEEFRMAHAGSIHMPQITVSICHYLTKNGEIPSPVVPTSDQHGFLLEVLPIAIDTVS